MKTCLQLGCFANHHGMCVGDKKLAMRLSNCTDFDDLPENEEYRYDD